jgi:anaerobic magnesium-protoporphyrin IX monomethyl ester cyclase
MKYALVNPNWTFTGSTYFGCREAHLPLEYGYSKALLERDGHTVLIVDGQLDNLSRQEVTNRVAAFEPDFTVVTTAPSYLFWRCAPPELRVPQETVRDLRDIGGTMVAVGPHGSTTPKATLKKLGVDVVVMGECEEVLPELTEQWQNVPSICYWNSGEPCIQGSPHASDMTALPALHWQQETIQRHHHHHHRFDTVPITALSALRKTSATAIASVLYQ